MRNPNSCCFMLLKFQYHRCLETYGGGVEYWVRIETDDNTLLLDYHGLKPHRKLHLLLSSFGMPKGTDSSFQLICGEDYYLALEIPDLIQEQASFESIIHTLFVIGSNELDISFPED